MDYTIFLQGFFFLLGGVLLIFLARIPPIRTVLLYCCLFCFFYAVHAAFAITVLLQERGGFLDSMAHFYALASVAMLYGAGARVFFRSARSVKFLVCWFLPVLLTGLCWIFLPGLPLDLAVLWSFGLPGAVLLSVGLRMQARYFQGEVSRGLILLAYGFIGFAIHLLVSGKFLVGSEQGGMGWPDSLFGWFGALLAFYFLVVIWWLYESSQDNDAVVEGGSSRFSLRRIVLPLFILTIFLGWVFTEWLGRQEEQILIRGLILRAALIEEGLQTVDLDGLKGRVDDLSTKEHGQVRRVLQQFSDYLNGACEVYLITQDGPEGGWFFLADSAGESSTGRFAPGAPFLRNGPVHDWKTILRGEPWISPPLLSESGLAREIFRKLERLSGSRPMVLGLRVDEEAIRQHVVRERLIGIVVTFCFFGLLSGVYVINRLNESTGHQIESARRHLLMALDSAGLSTWEWRPRSSLFSMQYPLTRFSAELQGGEIHQLEDFLNLIDSDLQEEARCNIEELAAGRIEAFELEIPLLRKGRGDVFWLFWKGGVSQKDAAGQIVLISGTLQSIQERVAAQKALAQSRESLRQVVGTVFEVIFETDQEGRWTFLNPAWESLTGLPVRESVGQDLNRFLALDRNQSLRRKFAAFLAGGGEDPLRETLPIQRVDGTQRWIEITANRLSGGNKGARGMAGTLRDVTEQRRNQRILESIVLINSGLISTRLEKDGWQYSLRLLGEANSVERVWVAHWENSKFVPQATWEGGEVMGGSLPLLLPEAFSIWRDDLQEGRELMGTPEGFSAGLAEFFGKRGTVGFLAVPIFAGVEFWGVLCFEASKKDRSWGREELALLRSAAAAFGLCLARQKGDDALQEATTAARQAAEAAEAANRAKSAFLATMSHEIRTPLNAVIGMASLLQESTLTSQQQEYATTVVGASKSLLDLINDILDYSKIEAGRIELHPEETDLAGLAVGCLEMLQGNAVAKGIHLAYDVPPDFPARLFMDGVRTRQVLLNLLSNGVKFTGRGSVILELSAHPTSRGMVRVEIRVSDTGIGIPQHMLPRLFTPFLQADSSITRKYGGTGLGLAISKRLLDAMGGQIEVESSSGEGTRFLISLEVPVVDSSPYFRPDPELVDSLRPKQLISALSLPVTDHLLDSYLGSCGLKMRRADSYAELLRFLEKAPDGSVVIFDRELLPNQGQHPLPRLVQLIAQKSSRVLLLADRPQEVEQELQGSLACVLPCLFRLTSFFQALSGQSAAPSTDVEGLGLETKQEKAEAGGTGVSNVFGELRILVAEDNLNNQRVLRLMLRKMGCHLQMVDNGLQALQAARTSTFDLIILDLQMPVMDGLTAVGKLREYYASKSPPRPVIMALTANAFEEDRTTCLEGGFDYYLAKPVSASQLREAMGQCLEKGIART